LPAAGGPTKGFFTTEDTEHTEKFLNHQGTKAPTQTTETQRRRELLSTMKNMKYMKRGLRTEDPS
jgi:hypothetical protein